MQVADLLKKCPGLRVITSIDGGNEILEDDPFDVRSRRQQQMVLHGVEGREGIAVRGHQLPQPPGGGFEHVLLPPGEQVGVILAIEQVGVLLAARHGVRDPLRQAANRGPFEHRPDDLVRDVADHRDRIHALELVAEIREQAFRHQLE